MSGLEIVMLIISWMQRDYRQASEERIYLAIIVSEDLKY